MCLAPTPCTFMPGMPPRLVSLAPTFLLAAQVAAATGFRGTIQWDLSKPDGTPKKQLDVSRLAALGWRAQIQLDVGLLSTVEGFCLRLSQQEVRL